MKQLLFEIYNKEALSNAVNSIRKDLEGRSYSSLLFHMYCGLDDEDWILEIRDTLAQAFPRAELCGVSSHAEIIKGSLTDPVILLSAMIFEKTETRVFFFPDILDNEADYGRQVRNIIDDSADIKACEILMQGAPLDSLAFLNELEQCRKDVKIFGGYPISHEVEGGRRFLVTEGGIFDNAIVLVVYSGEAFHIDVGYTAGWKPLGRTFTVTKAHKNTLYSVDNFDASELYKKYLDIDLDEDFVTNTMEFPLLAEDDGRKMLRHCVAGTEEGTLELAGYIREGMTVTMAYGDPTEIVAEVDVRAEQVRQFEPEAVLIYTCTMRKIFWNYFINNEMAPFQKLAETCGFCTGGELNRDPESGNIMWHNITMLTIAMREGEKTGREIAPVRVDASQMHGQASLVNRLTTLVRVTSKELRETLGDLEEANKKLLHMATVDELTALFNRREIERRINAAIDEAEKTGRQVALVMMDVDHFKRVNDTYGHETGDKILEGVAAVLNATVKEYDGEAVGRWGGEEFFLLMPGTSLEEAVERAEEIRQTVELYPFPKVRQLTCSLGVTVTTGGEDKKAIYTRVDNALYEAKESGRNRVVVGEARHNPKE